MKKYLSFFFYFLKVHHSDRVTNKITNIDFFNFFFLNSGCPSWPNHLGSKDCALGGFRARDKARQAGIKHLYVLAKK